MRRYVLSVLVVGLAVALSVGVATATAGGGNSANAKLCQKNGWMNQVRSDGTSFNNEDECVSYGAKGGTLMPKPTCTAGSENFSEDAARSQPTAFAGGTINTAYGPVGGVFGPVGGFLATASTAAVRGVIQTDVRDPVNSVRLDAESDSGQLSTPTSP